MPIKEKRHVEAYWETHEITTISFKRDDSTTVYCHLCDTETPHLTISEAASISGLSEFELFRTIEADQVHSMENAAGTLFVCGNSLAIFKGTTDEK